MPQVLVPNVAPVQVSPSSEEKALVPPEMEKQNEEKALKPMNNQPDESAEKLSAERIVGEEIARLLAADIIMEVTTRKRAIDGNGTNGAPDMWCAISIY